EELALRGIRVLFHTALVELVGIGQLTSVRISTTSADSTQFQIPNFQLQTFPADLFIFATGTLPNKELAGSASGRGLDCDKGILINNHMQTSDEHIFAIGECAELI